MKQYRLLCTAFFALVAVSVLSFAGVAAEKNADAILAAVTGDDDHPVWGAAEELRKLGYNAEHEILEAANIPGTSIPRRLAAASALLQLGYQRDGTVLLEAIILDGGAPAARRLEAASLLGKWGGEYAAARLGILMDGPGMPERLRVELAYSLWKLTSRPHAYDTLEEIRTRGSSPLARIEALLALAQTDRFQSLRLEVEKAAELPGVVGERASNILLLNSRLSGEIGRDGFTEALIAEVVGKIRAHYAVDENDSEQAEKLEPKAMAEAGAQALLLSIDQFNDYLNEADFADLDAQLKANYGGIGAWVGMRDSHFTILTPMFEKPAYKAGLRPMDVIDRVDEKDITAMKQNEIIKLLKGEPGSLVSLRILRRDWNEPHTVQVKREIIQIESVLWQMLPGNIGYIRINGFNEGDPFHRVKSTAALVRDAMGEFNRQGAKGLILDMTNNPGGVMVSGVDVAKLFIGDRKLIVSSRGRKNTVRSTEYKADWGRPFYQKPVVVAMNGGTASAAEIVAGALRDHKRATLVGRKTYGKGSVQTLLGVDTARGRARIKLTIAKYYLPDGDCIHKKGIDPDRKSPEANVSASEAEARWKIRDQHDIQFWLEDGNRFNQYERKYRDLLVFDNFDPYSYPEFESLLGILKAKYPKEMIDAELIRKELRYGIASYLRDYKGEKHYADLEENAVLQEALITLGEEIGGLPEEPLFAAIRSQVEENRRKVAEEDNKEIAAGE